jgi:hypothetical protein
MVGINRDALNRLSESLTLDVFFFKTLIISKEKKHHIWQFDEDGHNL